MPNKSLAMILSVSVLSLSACSHFHKNSKEESGAPIAKESFNAERHYEHNELTVAERSGHLSGAGCNAPGVVHVVDVNTCSICEGQHLPTESAPVMKTPEQIPPQTKPVGEGLSIYDLQRWERYCSGGKLLTHADWKFLIQQGLNNVPGPLASKCTPPSFSYDQYLSAWKHYCSASKVTLNDQEKSILKTTQVRPKDIVGNCLGKP